MKQLKTFTNGLEDAIITISGPALAVSGIIAGVDLLTGGNIMTQVSWFSLTWAITLLISLDFNVLALGARARKLYRSRSWRELIIATLLAAGISYVSVQMQSIIALANTANIPIAVATEQMGISPFALIWERSALVLLLIFLSGWIREDDKAAEPEPQTAVQAASSISAEHVQVILDKLATLEMMQQSVAVAQESGLASLPERTETLKSSESGLTPPEKVDETLTKPWLFESKEAAVAAILARMPDATPEQVAQEADCTEKTAQKWMAKYSSKKGSS